MDRIGPAGGAPTVELPDSEQGFVDQNLGTGQQGTNVPALFMNALMEEVMNVLAAAGVTPNINNWTQLLQSIQAIIANDFDLIMPDLLESQPGGFVIPALGTAPVMQVFLGNVTVPVGQTYQDVLLPGTWNAGLLGGLACDSESTGYQCGVWSGNDNSHVRIYCPVYQINQTNQSIGARGQAQLFFLAWGH